MTVLLVIGFIVNLAVLIVMFCMWNESVIDADDFMFHEGFKIKHILWIFAIPAMLIAYLCIGVAMLLDGDDDNFWNKKLF